MPIIFDLKSAKKLLPVRSNQSNKADGGRSLIIAGHKGMWGAAVLASTACARAGSGYVILMSDKKFPSTKHPDFLTADFKKNISSLNVSAVAIGPGLGVNKQTIRILKKIYSLNLEKVVIDADAINALSKQKSFSLKTSWILTPHEGELARLLNVSSQKIKNNREYFVKAAAKKYNCILVLKGYETLVATSQKVYKVKSGNKALAKAGTGDVLTGIITAFLAQGLTSLDAALLGVYVHGYLADEWTHAKNDYLGLMASDLVAMLPKAIYKLRNKK